MNWLSPKARRNRRPCYCCRRGHRSTQGPDSIEVRARSLQAGGGVCASFAVTGYPAEVGAGWLEPLLTYPGRLEVAMHIEPLPPAVAADRLKRQLARLESGVRSDADHGWLEDFHAVAAADDARDLAAAVARGETRLLRGGLYLTVHARDDNELRPNVPGNWRRCGRCTPGSRWRSSTRRTSTGT